MSLPFCLVSSSVLSLFPRNIQLKPKQNLRVEIVTSLRDNPVLNFLKRPLKIFFFAYPAIFLIALLFERMYPIYGILTVFLGILSILVLAEAILFGYFGIKVIFSPFFCDLCFSFLKKTKPMHLLNFSFPFDDYYDERFYCLYQGHL